MRHWIALVLIVLAACSSAPEGTEPVFHGATEAVLREAGRVELLTLDPMPLVVTGAAGVRDFHGYEVLDAAELTSTAQRAKLIAAVKRGILSSDGVVAACFNPRHGIRFEHGNDVVEFVICYECLSLDVHGPAGAENFETVSSVQRAVDAVFATVGLKIQGK